MKACKVARQAEDSSGRCKAGECQIQERQCAVGVPDVAGLVDSLRKSNSLQCNKAATALVVLQDRVKKLESGSTWSDIQAKVVESQDATIAQQAAQIEEMRELLVDCYGNAGVFSIDLAARLTAFLGRTK